MTRDDRQPRGPDEHGQLVRKAGRHRLLTGAEEIALAKRIERGDADAKKEMIEWNLSLVFAVARCYRGRGVPFEDLVQEGTLGLVRAVEKFDHRRGLKFSTYAVWWIRRSLMNGLSGARAIRIPAAATQQLATIHRAENELRRLHRGAPTVDEIADRTGLSVRSVRTLLDAARVTASLDEPVGEDGTLLGELIADGDGDSAWQRTDERETCREVWSMLRVLPDRHREVILRRYGFRDGPAQTHAEVGAWLGVGEERSRQLERQALHWLRELGGGAQRVA
jgi:RNA polymerase primary sigma factor